MEHQDISSVGGKTLFTVASVTVGYSATWPDGVHFGCPSPLHREASERATRLRGLSVASAAPVLSEVLSSVQ